MLKGLINSCNNLFSLTKKANKISNLSRLLMLVVLFYIISNYYPDIILPILRISTDFFEPIVLSTRDTLARIQNIKVQERLATIYYFSVTADRNY